MTVSGYDRELSAHFCCVAALKYHAPDTWHDITSSLSAKRGAACTIFRNLSCMVCRGPGLNPWPQVSRSGHSTDWATGAGTPLVCTWRYCTCMCKLLMFRSSRSVQMLHNVKKNKIDLSEVHVSSSQIHEHLQINLKCTDERPQIIWSYVCTFGTPNYWKKRQVTLKGF